MKNGKNKIVNGSTTDFELSSSNGSNKDSSETSSGHNSNKDSESEESEDSMTAALRRSRSHGELTSNNKAEGQTANGGGKVRNESPIKKPPRKSKLPESTFRRDLQNSSSVPRRFMKKGETGL